MSCLVNELKPGFAKWIYFAGFLLTAILTWVCRDYAVDFLASVPSISKCADEQVDQKSCVCKEAVLRISFGNFMFFALHAILLLGVSKKNNPRALIHTGFWWLKTLLWIGLIGVTLAMPNGVFRVYGEIARILSCFFIVFQLVVLLDWVYEINEFLIDKSGTVYKAILILSTFILYAGAFVIIGFLYHNFAPQASCHLNIFFITWTIILGIAFTLISISPYRVQYAGLLTSAAVFAYCVFLVASALNSQPVGDGTCVRSGQTGNKAVQVVGFFIAVGAIVVSTLSTGSYGKTFDLEQQRDDDALDYRLDFFHFIFLLAASYMAMVFTSWNLEGTPHQFQVDSGRYSMWVKMVSQWVCAALYVFSMMAPRILRNREFA